ncbi:hypothetical protein TRFO_08180 [Tritrichomonas foetus]|uniref:Uncharacterized protein n=1 Tax=Tritrichomonas foetus TaxID=1144522 RepID=A0A1J4JQT1_9EUKA|nr:hypothetical protein TRFO_08180 [Tritrichomonas foetus]|eukprot:OHS99877.1 hypothetical protein TRFO_08180 [Tritrichomonas foetus]
MIDCSPGSGTATPDARVNHVKKKREKLQLAIQELKSEIENNESDIQLIQQNIEMNKRKIQEKLQEYNHNSNILTDLEKRMQHLSTEYGLTSETILRYKKMTQQIGPLTNPQDVKKEIIQIKNEIIMMEKEIIEYRNQSILAQQIAQAQKQRTILLEKDANLLEKLNSLTVQLRVLQFTGDKKLLTDSEYIIEKQLTSEELRNELEMTLGMKQKSQENIENNQDKNESTQNNSKSINYKGKSFDLNEISASVEAIKDRLNLYLKRDRKIDEMERNKRRKLTVLQQMDTTIDKYKHDHDRWTVRKNNIAKDQERIEEQIEIMKNNGHLDSNYLKEILNEKKSNYEAIKSKRKQVAAENQYLTIDTANAESTNWKKKIDQIAAEIEALENTKADLLKRQETYRKLNTEDGIREIQEVDRSYKKVEGEIDTIIMNSSKVRRRKKELNQQITKILVTLTNRGITAPPYTFKSGNIFSKDDDS